MKRMSRYRILAVLITATILFGACTKEGSKVRLEPQLTTTQVINVKSDSATVVGFVVAAGDGFTERGVCYNTAAAPTIANTKVIYMGESTSATFNVILTDLAYATEYFARAYATNAKETIYGDEYNFTTLPIAPTVTTTAITEITGASATGGGNVTDDGGTAITERGVCWSTSADPTIADSKTSDGTGSGEFTSSLTGLALGTTYHVRAYAKNSVVIGYGPEVVFQTFPTELFMIGDGVGGWDWAVVDLPMVPVNGTPNLFWKIVWMEATGEFKFAPAKAWGGDFGKTGDATDGVYNKGGDNIPVPGIAGYYMVVVDLAAGKIAIADPKVYLMGNTIGSWDIENAAGLFTVDNANSVVTITKVLVADNLRMYAWHPWFTDWWRSEFNIFSGKIEFRGNGGDQAAVPVTAGSHTIDLNFKTGNGTIN